MCAASTFARKLPPSQLTLLNPALVAVHYVMAGGDLKRNVRKTAAKIASQTTEQFQPKK